MNSNKLGNSSGNNTMLSKKSGEVGFSQVEARLALLTPTQLSKDWKVNKSTITKLLSGEFLNSSLMPKLARRIKCGEVELRSYLVEASERYGAQHVEQSQEQPTA